MPQNKTQIKDKFISLMPHKVEITELIRQNLITEETMRDYIIVLYLRRQVDHEASFPRAVEKAAKQFNITERWVRNIYKNSKFQQLH